MGTAHRISSTNLQGVRRKGAVCEMVAVRNNLLHHLQEGLLDARQQRYNPPADSRGPEARLAKRGAHAGGQRASGRGACTGGATFGERVRP